MSEGSAKAPEKGTEKQRKFQAIKGVRDILPPETALWNRVEQTAHQVFATYGYGEIRLPVFEPTELFARSIGVETDVVSKEMYSFEDRDEISVSLRPEATASVCRAYIEHGMHTLPQPVRLYYLGPMFRRERPQKGRYRQFYQIGAEVLGGAEAPAIDAEVIEMVMTYFAKLGLEGAALYINSIGCKECRPKYVALLKRELEKVKDKLGADSQRRIETNPLRVLDSKLEEEQKVIEHLPRISEHLCAACRDNYAAVKSELGLRGIQYQENWRLVRGLDYYVRTTFEITAAGLGSQNAVCGGGRYDGLVELLGGPPTKGTGFAIGEDRVVLSLLSQGAPVSVSADVLIAWRDEASYQQAQQLARLLRDVGLVVQLPLKAMDPREGLGLANRLGIPIGVVIGPNEVSAGVFSVKVLSEGIQTALETRVATEVGRLLLFRVLLERVLSQLARRAGIPTAGRPPLSLLPDLITKRILPGDLVPSIQLAKEAFNRVAHGELPSAEEQTRAVSNALFVLDRLSKMYGVNLSGEIEGT